MLEWFYPAELKQYIKDLESHGDLNKTALSGLNTIICILLCVSIPCFVLLLSEASFLFFSVLVLGMIIYLRYVSREVFVNCMSPYIENIKIKGHITKKKRDFFNRNIIFQCQLDNGSKGSFKIYITSDEIDGFDINKQFEFFYNPNNTEHIMPNVGYINKKYCLSNSIIKENNNE